MEKVSSRFCPAGTKFSHVIVSVRLSATKNLISQSVREKLINVLEFHLIEFHYFTEAATEDVLQRRCS